MAKTITNKRKKDTRRAALIKDTATIRGVSTRQVQYALNAERKDEKTIEVFMELTEGYDKLLNEVKKLVPFN